jgi:ABC-type transporter Mla subunit MlaD
MKRLAGAVAGLLAIIAVVAAVAGAPARSADTYRVDAIFDTAKGVIPGQLVKIAGARVGEIADVRLTRDYKARIVMTVPRRFQFRSDASCNIQPEGLISENFVQCDPGTPSKGLLRGIGDLPPTVPVQRTSVPVNLTDLFRIFKTDVRQRFTVAIAGLGGGLAARGGDLNAVILRANPTLRAIRRLSSQLAAQKRQLVRAVADTDTVIGSLARNSGDVQRFIVSTGRVTRRTAAHRVELAESIRRLPALLDATDPAVGNLNRLATQGRPLLAQLRASTPALERLLDQVQPFSAAAVPALTELGSFARTATPTIRHATPLVQRASTLSAELPEAARILARTLVDLRDRGFVENLNLFAYFGAAAQARFDSVSHIFASHPEIGPCSPYAQTPVPGCNAFYGPKRASAPAATAATATRAHRAPAARRPAASPGSRQTLDDLANFLLGS